MAPAGRLEVSGSFNSMVSHRVRLDSDKGVDKELVDWSTVVLKPTVSADSWETIRVEPERYAFGQAYLERHRPEREIVIQPFVKDVDEGGEQSLMLFGGRYSHTARRTPPSGEDGMSARKDA